jgi:tetratricopeptide (TPR) repeat protein
MVLRSRRLSARIRRQSSQTSSTRDGVPVDAKIPPRGEPNIGTGERYSLTSEAPRVAIRPLPLTSLKGLPSAFSADAEMSEVFLSAASSLFLSANGRENAARITEICFVAPVLPHTCILDIWNGVVASLNVVGTVITSVSEQPQFNEYAKYANAQGFGVSLEIKTLESMEENRTFLAGIDSELDEAQVVVALGETSLATYQAMKHCRRHLKRLVVWQNAPRPLHTLPGSRFGSGFVQPHIAREKSMRREILKSCEVLLCFDKESATLAYLEGVSGQRIRRVSRGISRDRYSPEFREIHRSEIRKALGLADDQFVFLQVGPLEVEAGAFDTLFAFKNLLQSAAQIGKSIKLVCCGHGLAAADIRQMVVDLGIDDAVYFLSQTADGSPQIRGDHLSHLVAVADAVIHNPVSPIGGEPLRFLDSTYDILCAVSYGIPVVSNGSGWIGEWMARFGRTFAPGNIHSQAKMMRDVFEKLPKFEANISSARRALENDLLIGSAVKDCARIFKTLVEQAPHAAAREVQDLFEQIESAVQSQRYVDAIQCIEQAFETGGLSPSQKSWLFRTVGDCFTRLGDLASGRDNYLRAAEMDPYCHKVFIGLGTVALQEKQYNVAVPHFHKAVGIAPKDDMANLGLGLAFEGLGEQHEARTWTLRACLLNPESRPALYNLVKLSHALDDYDETIPVIEKYLSLHPYDVHMLYTLGGLKYKVGSVDEALQLMRDVLRIDPMNNLAHSLVSQIERDARAQGVRASAQS